MSDDTALYAEYEREYLEIVRDLTARVAEVGGADGGGVCLRRAPEAPAASPEAGVVAAWLPVPTQRTMPDAHCPAP